MLTREQIENLTMLPLSCNLPAMELRQTALELYAKLEKAERKAKYWQFEITGPLAQKLEKTEKERDDFEAILIRLKEVHEAGKADAEEKYEWALAELATRFAEGFAKGKESVKRKNQSGCCCVITDENTVESVCGAHREWLGGELAELREALTNINLCRDKDCGTCAVPDSTISQDQCNLILIAKDALKRLAENKKYDTTGYIPWDVR